MINHNEVVRFIIQEYYGGDPDAAVTATGFSKAASDRLDG
jgi:hypothetical protein